MNDYRFGNYIYELRKRAGLSQSELGARIGVSNKAQKRRRSANWPPSFRSVWRNCWL